MAPGEIGPGSEEGLHRDDSAGGSGKKDTGFDADMLTLIGQRLSTVPIVASWGEPEQIFANDALGHKACDVVAGGTTAAPGIGDASLRYFAGRPGKLSSSSVTATTGCSHRSTRPLRTRRATASTPARTTPGSGPCRPGYPDSSDPAQDLAGKRAHHITAASRADASVGVLVYR